MTIIILILCININDNTVTFTREYSWNIRLYIFMPQNCRDHLVFVVGISFVVSEWSLLWYTQWCIFYSYNTTSMNTCKLGIRILCWETLQLFARKQFCWHIKSQIYKVCYLTRFYKINVIFVTCNIGSGMLCSM